MKFTLKSKWYVSGLLIAAVAFSLAFVAGCSQNAVAPKTENPGQAQLEWLNFKGVTPTGVDKATPIGLCAVELDTVVSGWVGYFGGHFELRKGTDKLSFDLPARSVWYNVRLTVHATKYVAPFGPFWLLDCGPSGTIFAKPLSVKLDSQSGTGYDILYYYDEASGQWVVQEVVSASNGTFNINHFSKYGISN